MRHLRVIICESDGKLGTLLRPVAGQHRWLLRSHRQPTVCLRELQDGNPSLLVIKAGRDLERELSLLDCAGRRYPETPIVFVGDLEHPLLAGLAWDLGAAYVLFPPQPRELLREVVENLAPGPVEYR